MEKKINQLVNEEQLLNYLVENTLGIITFLLSIIVLILMIKILIKIKKFKYEIIQDSITYFEKRIDIMKKDTLSSIDYLKLSVEKVNENLTYSYHSIINNITTSNTNNPDIVSATSADTNTIQKDINVAKKGIELTTTGLSNTHISENTFTPSKSIFNTSVTKESSKPKSTSSGNYLIYFNYLRSKIKNYLIEHPNAKLDEGSFVLSRVGCNSNLPDFNKEMVKWVNDNEPELGKIPLKVTISRNKVLMISKVKN